MKKRDRFIAGILLAAAAVCIPGCGKMVEASVLAAQETEKGAELPQESVISKSVEEQVAAPEKYVVQTTVDQVVLAQTDAGTEDGDAAPEAVDQEIYITADAPVTVPQTEEIHIKRMEETEIGQEQALEWIKYLSGQQEPELEIEDEAISGIVVVGDIPYTCSVSDTELGPAFLWVADWSGLVRTEEGVQNMQTMGRVAFTEKSEEEYKAETDEMLNALGFRDFTLAYMYEDMVTVGYQTKDVNEAVKQTQLYYERVVDGVQVTSTHQVPYPVCYEEDDGRGTWVSDLLWFTYIGGRLESIVYMAPKKVADYSDESLFLLPFDEVKQIFENTIGPQMAGGKKRETNPSAVLSVFTQYPGLTFTRADVCIDSVQLEYLHMRETDDAAGEAVDLLVPVWNFYGTWTAVATQENGEEYGEKMEMEHIALLTVDARDGTVIQRYVGY